MRTSEETSLWHPRYSRLWPPIVFDRRAFDLAPSPGYDTYIVRRALASLLVALFGFPLIAPLLAASPESQLPACCRRLGKHRCEMASTTSTDGKPVLQASHCASFPATGLVLATQYAATVAAPRRLSVALATTQVRNAASTAGSTTVVYRACPKRGPPVLILSLNKA
jgi:hypothetical protein